MKTENKFLNIISQKARENRISYWEQETYSIRTSLKNDKKHAGLWFKTIGCFHDKQGGCSICDYSNGENVADNEIVNFVKKGLSTLTETYNELIVTPSGSMFDENEVSKTAREEIFQILKNTKHEGFAFETRADTITKSKIAKTQNILNNRLTKIYIGLETSNPWLLKYSINKNLDLNRVINSYKLLINYGITSISNILLGIPFLTEKESIEDTVSTIKWSLQHGSQKSCIFPVHIKKDTIGEILFNLKLYNPPSLWSLIEVLKQFKTEIKQNKIEISWYTAMGAYNIVSSPTTCPICYEKVIKLLDKFDNSGNYINIKELDKMKCKCKDVWKDKLSQNSTHNLIDRVLSGYQILALSLFDEKWYKKNLNKIKNIESEYNCSC